MKSTFLVTALSVTIYLLEVNFCDAQNQSSSERGRMYEIRAKSRYRPSSLLRLESYPKILEPQNLEYDSSEYVMDKDVVSIVTLTSTKYNQSCYIIVD